MDATLLADLIRHAADRSPATKALTFGEVSLDYAGLDSAVSRFATGLMALGLARAERVAIYLDKRFETVIASFGTTAAGGVFVPLNPLLKPEQVRYILADCNVRILVTTPERLALLDEALKHCPDLRITVVAGQPSSALGEAYSQNIVAWNDLIGHAHQRAHRVIDTDMAAILYTSGSTG